MQVKTAQVLGRDLNVREWVWNRRGVGGVGPAGQALGTEANQFGVGCTTGHGLFDTPHRMRGQPLQDADVLASAGCRTVSLFQRLAELRECRWQPPIPVNPGMVESGRASFEGYPVMDRIEDLLAAIVAAIMTGYDLFVGDDLDVIDIRFNTTALV